jgi:hypothetical protein
MFITIEIAQAAVRPACSALCDQHVECDLNQ